MKRSTLRFLIPVVFLAVGCATVPVPDGYEELTECPAHMDADQAASGIVRCRALCSSYARNFSGFGMDCKCYCAPPNGSSGQGGYIPHQASFEITP